MAKTKSIPIDHKRFLKVYREDAPYRPVEERVNDYNEVFLIKDDGDTQVQASRCMDCGTPFCHFSCPIGNMIPEWNKAVQLGNWKEAYDILSATNNFPEFTGRICPALCEYGCVLGINDDPITIREDELAIIEKAYKEGYVKPNRPKMRTGKKVAVVGSGAAGLSVADQLNKAGHEVVVYERAKKIGGLLRYGIPDFKLDKSIIDRRQKVMEKGGIKFVTLTELRTKSDVKMLLRDYDAVCLTGGSRQPRDLKIKGRDAEGIYFAMEYLTISNQYVSGEIKSIPDELNAKGKRVVVIGGGDTGSDCIGTANRQGAISVTQLEVMPMPPKERSESMPWPSYPMLLKTTSSHKEGSERFWSVSTKEFIVENSRVKKLRCVKVEFVKEEGKPRPVMREISGTEFEIEADLVILAIGFIHPEHDGLISNIGLELDDRGNVKTDNSYMTSVKSVFSAGDMHRGQSLVVWAISEGRRAAYHIDKYLMGESLLPYI